MDSGSDEKGIAVMFAGGGGAEGPTVDDDAFGSLVGLAGGVLEGCPTDLFLAVGGSKVNFVPSLCSHSNRESSSATSIRG